MTGDNVSSLNHGLKGLNSTAPRAHCRANKFGIGSTTQHASVFLLRMREMQHPISIEKLKIFQAILLGSQFSSMNNVLYVLISLLNN